MSVVIVILLVVVAVVMFVAGFCLADWLAFREHLDLQSRIWELEDENYRLKLEAILPPKPGGLVEDVPGKPYGYPA